MKMEQMYGFRDSGRDMNSKGITKMKNDRLWEIKA